MFEKFTTAARSTVVIALEEALRAQAPEVRVEHLFLGVLESAHGALSQMLTDNGFAAETVRAQLKDNSTMSTGDAKALESIGIDLEAVTALLEANFGAGALDRSVPHTARRNSKRRWFGKDQLSFDSSAKAALAMALREAVNRHDREIKTEHVLLGVLANSGPVLSDLVPTATELRQSVITLLDTAA